MKEQVELVKNCCGCRACEKICPRKCITLQTINGFFRPVIDPEKCIKCGKCSKVCANMDEEMLEFKSMCTNVYAAWSKKSDIVRDSTSGGIFVELAQTIIEEGGVVFGAAFVNSVEVKIVSAYTMEELEKMRGAKYVFSDTDSSYLTVKSLLDKGKSVLYSGLPCQIVGLKKFLNKDYPNLYCVDLVCHGVSSQETLKKYVEYLEGKYQSNIVKFQFRTQEERDSEPFYYIEFSNGFGIREPLRKNQYSKVYNSLISHMPACSKCKYKIDYKISDITIGDFWGIDKENYQHYNKLGTSLIITNSYKGEELFNRIHENIVWYKECKEIAI